MCWTAVWLLLKSFPRTMKSAPRYHHTCKGDLSSVPELRGWLLCSHSTEPLNSGDVQTIKDSLDKKVGGPWHVVAGQNFSYDVTHRVWKP